MTMTRMMGAAAIALPILSLTIPSALAKEFEACRSNALAEEARGNQQCAQNRGRARADCLTRVRQVHDEAQRRCDANETARLQLLAARAKERADWVRQRQIDDAARAGNATPQR